MRFVPRTVSGGLVGVRDEPLHQNLKLHTPVATFCCVCTDLVLVPSTRAKVDMEGRGSSICCVTMCHHHMRAGDGARLQINYISQ